MGRRLHRRKDDLDPPLALAPSRSLVLSVAPSLSLSSSLARPPARTLSFSRALCVTLTVNFYISLARSLSLSRMAWLSQRHTLSLPPSLPPPPPPFLLACIWRCLCSSTLAPLLSQLLKKIGRERGVTEIGLIFPFCGACTGKFLLTRQDANECARQISCEMRVELTAEKEMTLSIASTTSTTSRISWKFGQRARL